MYINLRDMLSTKLLSTDRKQECLYKMLLAQIAVNSNAIVNNTK